MNLGYACINITLSNQKEKITTNRGMIKKTFLEKGSSYASDLGVKNCRDLLEIINWNHLNGINFFRLSSDIFPWKSQYDFKDLPNYIEISDTLLSAGNLAKLYNQRITAHPGPFNVLTSPHEHVVQNCIKDLTIHGDVFDMLGQSRTPYNLSLIHI